MLKAGNGLKVVEAELGLEGSQHSHGFVLVLREHGEDGLVIVEELRVEVHVLGGVDVGVHNLGNMGGHLTDLERLVGSSVKVVEEAVANAAAVTGLLVGKSHLDVSMSAVLIVDRLDPPLYLSEILDKVRVLN